MMIEALQFIHLLAGVPFTFHLVACLAFIPYFFTWTGVASALLGYFFIAALGINIGYHRLLAHRGVSCSKGWERFFAASAFSICSSALPTGSALN